MPPIRWKESGRPVSAHAAHSGSHAGSWIGVAASIGILIGGQLVMAVVIDRFGLFGVDQIALHWPRLLGIALLAAGAALSLRT